MKRMFEAAMLDLAAIHDALGLDPEDAAGAEPIIAAIEELKNRTQSLPSGWHAVPEHPTERQIIAGSQAINSADRYRRMVLSAPKLYGRG